MKSAFWRWMAIAMMALWMLPDASALAQRDRGGGQGNRNQSFAPRDSGQRQHSDQGRGTINQSDGRSRQFDQDANRGSRESFDRGRSVQSRDSRGDGRGNVAQQGFINRNFQNRGSLENMQRMNASQQAARNKDGRNFDQRNFDRRDGDHRNADRRDFNRNDYIGQRIAGYRGGAAAFGRYGYPWWAWVPGTNWGWGYGPGLGFRSPYYGYGWGLPYYGYGYGGYGGWGYSYPTGDTYVFNQTETAPTAKTADTQPSTADQASANEFVTAGEQAFRAGQYEQALRHWRHAMVEDANNGALVLLMAQALFQVGEYQNAAGAVQMAMQMLPESEWGNVVKNFTQIYGNPQHFTDRLKQLEVARTEKADDPALRFLLGYEFGYLRYPKEAVRELDKALDLQPRDMGSQKLRDMFALHAGLPARVPATQPAAPAPGDNPATTTPALPGLEDAPAAAHNTPQPPNKSVVPIPVQPE